MILVTVTEAYDFCEKNFAAARILPIFRRFFRGAGHTQKPQLRFSFISNLAVLAYYQKIGFVKNDC